MNPPPIDKKFVTVWSGHYMFHRSPAVRAKDSQTELEVKGWFNNQEQSKYLDLDHLKLISRWKSGERNVPRVKKNCNSDVQTMSRRALSPSVSEEERLPLLSDLKGVWTATASVMLHFAYPDRYPIWDTNVRQALACLVNPDWNADIGPKQFNRWSRYVSWMGNRCAEIDVSLRELEKALWQYAICRRRSMGDKDGSSCSLYPGFES